MVISFKIQIHPLLSHIFLPLRHRKACVKKTFNVHRLILEARWTRKSLPHIWRPPRWNHYDSLFLFPLPPPSPPFPSLPPSLPHQAHGMVNVWQWRAVGNDHGKTKQQQRSWQLEYSMMLNLHSRLSLWNTALALGMRNPIWKRWRCEIRGWLSVGMKCFSGLFKIWIVGPGPCSYTPFLINSKISYTAQSVSNQKKAY